MPSTAAVRKKAEYVPNPVPSLIVRWVKLVPSSGYEKLVGNNSWMPCTREEIQSAVAKGFIVYWNPTKNGAQVI